MNSGDGWTRCAAGHRHWGLYGAAGLLLVDPEHSRVVLQHRAAWTHQGDSWGVLGGARDRQESALEAAVREAGEEAGVRPGDVDPVGMFVDDHLGWSYTTVVARARDGLRPRAANAESISVRWHPIEEVDRLRLHTGFAAAWHRLRQIPRPLYLVTGPDLAGHPELAAIARSGIPAHRLPPSIDGGGLDVLLPHLVPARSAADAAGLAQSHAEDGQVLTALNVEQLNAVR